MSLTIETGTENPILRKISQPVPESNKTIQKLIKQMIAEVKNDPHAAGIAAPQVGKNIRIVVVHISERVFPMVNPVITNFSDQKNIDEEGCLSIPGEFGKVERHTQVTVEFFDDKSKKKRLTLKNFDARLVQHEVDHLDGILFTDRMTTEHLQEMHQAREQYNTL